MLKNGKNDFFFYLRQIHFGISGKNRIDLHTSTKTYLLITNRRDSGSWFNGHPQEAPLGGEKWPNRSIPEQPSKTMKWWRKKLFWASLYVSQDIHLDQMEAAMPHLWALRGLRGCYLPSKTKNGFLGCASPLCWDCSGVMMKDICSTEQKKLKTVAILLVCFCVCVCVSVCLSVYAAAILVTVLGQEWGLVPSEDSWATTLPHLRFYWQKCYHWMLLQ